MTPLAQATSDIEVLIWARDDVRVDEAEVAEMIHLDGDVVPTTEQIEQIVGGDTAHEDRHTFRHLCRFVAVINRRTSR